MTKSSITMDYSQNPWLTLSLFHNVRVTSSCICPAKHRLAIPKSKSTGRPFNLLKCTSIWTSSHNSSNLPSPNHHCRRHWNWELSSITLSYIISTQHFWNHQYFPGYPLQRQANFKTIGNLQIRRSNVSSIQRTNWRYDHSTMHCQTRKACIQNLNQKE